MLASLGSVARHPWSRGLERQGRAWRDLAPAEVGAGPPADARLVDVREAHEFHGEQGHLEGSELVPLGTLAGALDRWDRARPVLVICRSGRRAAAACELLVAEGFEAVYNLAGGMDAWRAEGQPVCVADLGPRGSEACGPRLDRRIEGG